MRPRGGSLYMFDHAVPMRGVAVSEDIMEHIDMLKAFLTDESGATMIEYGLIAALVSVAAIAALTFLGSSLTTIFTNVGTILTSV